MHPLQITRIAKYDYVRASSGGTCSEKQGSEKMSDAAMSLKMAMRSCHEAHEHLVASKSHAGSGKVHHKLASQRAIDEARAQVNLAQRLLSDFLESTTPKTSRADYLKGLYYKGKADGRCCRCSSPASKNQTMCAKHASARRI
jgi:hypothetical protein